MSKTLPLVLVALAGLPAPSHGAKGTKDSPAIASRRQIVYLLEGAEITRYKNGAARLSIGQFSSDDAAARLLVTPEGTVSLHSRIGDGGSGSITTTRRKAQAMIRAIES